MEKKSQGVAPPVASKNNGQGMGQEHANTRFNHGGQVSSQISSGQKQSMGNSELTSPHCNEEIDEIYIQEFEKDFLEQKLSELSNVPVK